MAKKLKIKLIKSTIGQKPPVCATVRSLGLGKLNSTVVVNPNPAISGMIATVKHLVSVEELD
ncbi:MAG: 50S ribosomal protein L30 [Treponemataceae bacterium]